MDFIAIADMTRLFRSAELAGTVYPEQIQGAVVQSSRVRPTSIWPPAVHSFTLFVFLLWATSIHWKLKVPEWLATRPKAN